ncbi:ribonuclease [Trichormus sp. NMC-1]|uniref:ribonuclease T2 family protein n=1 Tax=Trichormus sp. NMC-1 TaxID=1853259 RepID=UPI0009F3B146|nr:ribonuclease [Trichormus sp. NMC-1]
MNMQIKNVVIASCLLITTLAIPNSAVAQRPGTPGKFDFYVLALSWSPDHCAKNGNRNPQQCSQGRKYGFVLHGLWPQYQKGYPANCTTEKLPSLIKEKFRGLFPNDKLYNHQWVKHGTCTGEKPMEYLTLSRQLKYSLVIPSAYKSPEKPFRTTVKDLKSAFVSANSKFTANGIAPYCSDSGRFLQEIFFCYSKDGKAGICSEDILRRSRKSCGQANFLVRNVR